MNIPYAGAIVFARDATVICTCASYLYLKNDMTHNFEYFEEYSVSDPTIRGYANANTCNHAFGTYLLSHLRVASYLGLLWMCSTSLHTTPHVRV